MQTLGAYRIQAQKALHARTQLAEACNALRLINGIGDGFPGISLDRYNNHYQLQLFAGYQPDEFLFLKDWVLKEIKPEFFVVKDRSNPESSALAVAQIVLGSPESSRTLVQEYGVQFEVDLCDTVNPGLFLDMRQMRLRIQQIAAHKRVLNLFAYTCSFGLHARVGRCELVVNVDISSKILNKAAQNYMLNNLRTYSSDFVRAESIDYLKKSLETADKWDVIIADPPSFSRIKNKVFSIRKEIGPMIDNICCALKPGGYALISSNYSEFSSGYLRTLIAEKFNARNKPIKSWERVCQGEDFPGANSIKESTLNGWLVRI
jgi:23S rRNA (cytosine1962-C5)-methyltransferase